MHIEGKLMFSAPSELRQSSKRMSRSANDTGSMYFCHLAANKTTTTDSSSTLSNAVSCIGRHQCHKSAIALKLKSVGS